jgi:hypothetical protein
MKKSFALLLFTGLLLVPQYVSAGLPSDTCFPAVQCDSGEDFYGGSDCPLGAPSCCQLHVETVTGSTDSCQSINGAPDAGKAWAFSCEAGCYQRSVGGGSVDSCPGGVVVNGECLIQLSVLDDSEDTFSAGNGAYKIWDTNELSEIVHVGNAGCPDGTIAVSDSSSSTGWICSSTPSTTLDVRGNGLNLDIGRGRVYFENNTNDNQDGAGVTLRTSSNPSSGSIFAVRSSGQASRFWVGQNFTSSGMNPFYVGSSNSTTSNDTSLYATKIGGTDDTYFGGDVGIRTNSPGYALDVNGQANVDAICIKGGTCYDSWETMIEDETPASANLWTENGSNVYRPSGNVGIGVPSPGQKLDVSGTIRNTGSLLIGGRQVEIGGETTSAPYIDFKNSSSDDYDARFYLSGNDILTLAGANLGINTSSPQQRLHVNGNTRTNNIEINASGAYIGSNIYYDGGWKYRSDGPGIVYRNNSGNFQFLTAPDGSAGGDASVYTRMYITNDGNVGIGDSSPTETLDVNGDIGISDKLALRGNDSWLRLNQESDFSSGTYTPSLIRADGGFDVDGKTMISNHGYWHRAQSTVTDHYGYFEGLDSSGGRGFYLGYGNGGSRVDFVLDDASQLYIGSGNVGIGTSSPHSALEVAGSVIATGSNQLRAVGGNYGFFVRNDGNNTYFMLTDSGDQYGSWNGFRPLYINNSTGRLSTNEYFTVNDSATVNGTLTAATSTVPNPSNSSASVSLSWLNDVSRIRVGGNGAGAGNGFDIQGPGNTSYMKIGSSVGIGDNSPNATLHVAAPSSPQDGYAFRVQIGGSTKLSTWANGGTSIGANVEPNSNGLYVSGYTEIDDDMSVQDIFLGGGSSTTPDIKWFGGYATSAGEDLRFVITHGANSDVTAMEIEKDADVRMDSDTLFVDADRDSVAIGDTSPNATLHVAAPSSPQDGYAFRVQIDGSTKLSTWANGGTSIGGNTEPDWDGLYVSRTAEAGTVRSRGYVIAEDKVVAEDGYRSDNADADMTFYTSSSSGSFKINEYCVNCSYTRTRLTINHGGKVGIGDTTPTAQLEVYGSVGAYGFIDRSDIRLKENISPVQDALNKVLDLKPVNFDWKDNFEGKEPYLSKRSAGFIAQDVEKVIPELVVEDEEGYKSINYDGIIPYLTDAIQEQQVLIKDLQSQIDELKGVNN